MNGTGSWRKVEQKWIIFVCLHAVRSFWRVWCRCQKKTFSKTDARMNYGMNRRARIRLVQSIRMCRVAVNSDLSNTVESTNARYILPLFVIWYHWYRWVFFIYRYTATSDDSHVKHISLRLHVVLVDRLVTVSLKTVVPR